MVYSRAESRLKTFKEDFSTHLLYTSSIIQNLNQPRLSVQVLDRVVERIYHLGMMAYSLYYSVYWVILVEPNQFKVLAIGLAH